jgi:hypothetical protein
MARRTVDGKELAQFMIDFGVGVTASHRYALKRLDLDYFVTDGWDPPASGVRGAEPNAVVHAAFDGLSLDIAISPSSQSPGD